MEEVEFMEFMGLLGDIMEPGPPPPVRTDSVDTPDEYDSVWPVVDYGGGG